MKIEFFRPLDDKNDRLAFLISFLVGLFVIIIFRSGWFFFSKEAGMHFSDYLAAFLVVLVIGFYTGYILMTKYRTSISIDRASDNAYYLGLLFTLISLSVSLLKVISRFDVSNDIAVNSALLPDFGLALFSTIAGIICRIVLQQFKPNNEAPKEESMQSLAVLMQRLQNSIGELVANLNGLSSQTQVSMREIIERTTDSMTLITDQTTESIARSSAKSEEVLDKLVSNMTQLGDRTVSEIDKLATMSDKTVASIDKFESTISVYARVNDQVGGLADKQERLSVELANAMEQLVNSISKLNANEIDKSINNVVTSLSETDQRLENLVEKTDHLEKVLTKAEKSVETKNEKFSSFFEDVGAATVRYVNALTESSKSLRNKRK